MGPATRGHATRLHYHHGSCRYDIIAAFCWIGDHQLRKTKATCLYPWGREGVRGCPAGKGQLFMGDGKLKTGCHKLLQWPHLYVLVEGQEALVVREKFLHCSCCENQCTLRLIMTCMLNHLCAMPTTIASPPNCWMTSSTQQLLPEQRGM